MAGLISKEGSLFKARLVQGGRMHPGLYTCAETTQAMQCRETSYLTLPAPPQTQPCRSHSLSAASSTRFTPFSRLQTQAWWAWRWQASLADWPISTALLSLHVVQVALWVDASCAM